MFCFYLHKIFCLFCNCRGANAYSPGITAIPNGNCYILMEFFFIIKMYGTNFPYTKGVVIGDKVSVFGDLLGQCKRGWNKEYEGKKYFVGNGLLLQNRQDLFKVGSPR